MTALAPSTNEDRLPHDRAVWRDHDGSSRHPAHTYGKPVTLEYGTGPISQTHGDDADWRGCQRWRFGWAPSNQEARR